MDDERLKDTGGGRYWRELLERIRDKATPPGADIEPRWLCVQSIHVCMKRGRS